MKSLLLLLFCMNLLTSCSIGRRVFCPTDGCYDFYFSYEQYNKFGKVYFFNAQRFRDKEEVIFPFTDWNEIKGSHLTNAPPDMVFVGRGIPLRGTIDHTKVQWPMIPEGLYKIHVIQENINLTK